MKKIYTFLILFFILIFSENLFARPISRWFFSNDFQGPIFITEISAAKADKTNWGQIWIKDTTPNEFWFTDDAGTDFQLGVTATAFDSTTVDATTWSDGANASNIWTFDVSGVDHTQTASSGSMDFSHNVSAATYGSDGSITDAEFLFINTLTRSAQSQINDKEGTLTNEAGLYSALSDVSNFTQPGVAETITENWVNTANPWADNEVADNITLTDITQITNRAITSLSMTQYTLLYAGVGYAPLELAFGASGTYLKSNGASSAPSWDTPIGATAWDDIGNPDAASEIDMGAYITEFNVQDFRIGDGGSNYVKFSATGMTFVGTYGITADWDFADASTVAAAVGEFRYDNAATGMDGGALNFHNGTEVKYLLDYATLPTADGQFPIYDETSDKFVPLAMSGHATMTETGAVSLAVNSVDSDQYVDGSIDIAHMSTDSVDYDNTTGSYKVAVLVGDPDSWTLTTALHYGGTLIASAAGEDTLDAIAVGMSLTLQADDTIAAIFNPNSSDTIILNGVSLAQGEALISDDTAGTFSIGVCQYRAANTWDCSCSDGMTEETP